MYIHPPYTYGKEALGNFTQDLNTPFEMHFKHVSNTWYVLKQKMPLKPLQKINILNSFQMHFKLM